MEHANPFALIFILLMGGVLFFYVSQARRGKDIYVRRIPGIDAIDETLGRSVELGRPIAFTSGLISIGPLFYACLSVLHYVAEKIARFSSKIYVPCFDPEVLVLSDATLQSAYQSANRLSQYDPTDVRYLSNNQFAYASGYMGLVHRENVGGAFLFGSFAAESLILAEAGQQVGAMQVAATTSNEQIPFFITTCDHTLIGEELYAAGAYLSNNSVQRGSLRAQDIMKLLLVALIVLGTIQATFAALSASEEPIAALKWVTGSWSAKGE
ncbi:MAG: hypothetical protein IT292_08680 [Deltaproteobacteria bacterium]|nr:hypothetical protein [Deltaproteobacteria bacterium]